MLAINLLNWRSTRIKILNRRFAAFAGAAIVFCLIITGLIFLYVQMQIDTARDDVVYLDSQLKSVAGILEEIKGIQEQKDILLSRRSIIEVLQASRPLVVNIFDNLARALPDGVVLTDLSRKDNDILMNGVADSNYTISLFMENVQKLPWVKSAKLGELQTSEGKKSTDGITSTDKITFQLRIAIDTAKTGVENETPGN